MNRYAQTHGRRYVYAGEEIVCGAPPLFTEPRCLKGPKIPDPNDAAAAGALQETLNFPFTYAIDAAAKMGTRWTDPLTGQVYDFTGLGDAANQAAVSDQMAQTLLDIQRDYGAEYIKQRLADLKQSDPIGYAARKQLFDRILADAERNPDRPLAEATQDLIVQTLQRGGQLDARQRQQVQERVRGGQVARGITLGNAPANEETQAIVGASDELKRQRQQQGLEFLSAGVSPEDVEYRRIQQALANLGAFVNQETPAAQFRQLSGAQQGAAPFTSTGAPSTALDPNAAAQGINNAFLLYHQQLQQANPVLGALSTGVSTFNTMVNLGYNPWRPATATANNPWAVNTSAPVYNPNPVAINEEWAP